MNEAILHSITETHANIPTERDLDDLFELDIRIRSYGEEVLEGHFTLEWTCDDGTGIPCSHPCPP